MRLVTLCSVKLLAAIRTSYGERLKLSVGSLNRARSAVLDALPRLHSAQVRRGARWQSTIVSKTNVDSR
jgi:hypothetical protein